ERVERARDPIPILNGRRILLRCVTWVPRSDSESSMTPPLLLRLMRALAARLSEEAFRAEEEWHATPQLCRWRGAKPRIPRAPRQPKYRQSAQAAWRAPAWGLPCSPAASERSRSETSVHRSAPTTVAVLAHAEA